MGQQIFVRKWVLNLAKDLTGYFSGKAEIF